MPTLGYQSRDEFRDEHRGSLLRKVFGPYKQDVWKQLAAEMGAQFVDGGLFHADKVVAAAGPWTVTLDTFSSGSEHPTTYTRLRAPFVNADGLRFTVFRAHVFTGIAKALGFQDIEIGDPRFDDLFVIRGNNERQIRRLFANPALRDLLHAQPNVHFSVRDDEGWFAARFPDGVDELYFRAAGTIKDLDRLNALFDLFAETLNTLCHIGSAYEEDPGIVLT
jgi:hypothetical protein